MSQWRYFQFFLLYVSQYGFEDLFWYFIRFYFDIYLVSDTPVHSKGQEGMSVNEQKNKQRKIEKGQNVYKV